jgi:hypothetical protein
MEREEGKRKRDRGGGEREKERGEEGERKRESRQYHVSYIFVTSQLQNIVVE